MEYSDMKMAHRFEQVMLYSPSEYRRRIDGVIDLMTQRDLAAVIFMECAEEAYDEWLLGERFLDYLIVRTDGVAVGIPGRSFRTDESGWSTSTEGGMLLSPYCDGAALLPSADADAVAALLASGTPKRIGVVLPQHTKAALADSIRRALPCAEWVDLTIPVALFRAVKSQEELYVIRQARNIQTAVFEALPQLIRLGRRVDDINVEIKHLLREMGASGVVHGGLICSGKQTDPMPGLGGPPDHQVSYGDRFFALMEANGPGHHHVAFGRHFVIGDLDKNWRQCIDVAADIHRYAVSLMKPNSLTLSQIAVKTRKYANTLGYTLRESIGWNWMHSMGAYYYEQYSLEDYTEDIPLQKNILLHCHPLIYREFPDGKREDIFILNTYLVSENGAEDLIGIPMEPFSLY